MQIRGALSALLGRDKKHDFSSGQLPISMLDPDSLLRFAKECYESAFYLDGSQWELCSQAVALGWPLGLATTAAVDYKRDVDATHNMAKLLATTADRAIGNVSAQRALSAAIKFETGLLSALIGAVPNEAAPPGPTLRELFDEFLRAVAPVPESYRAHAAWRELRRHVVWAKDLNAPAPLQSQIKTFRDELKTLGVRPYWGPRT
jgi:hypothetical protein